MIARQLRAVAAAAGRRAPSSTPPWSPAGLPPWQSQVGAIRGHLRASAATESVIRSDDGADTRNAAVHVPRRAETRAADGPSGSALTTDSKKETTRPLEGPPGYTGTAGGAIVAGRFYKRELPDTCVPLVSAEGRARFSAAMAGGSAECFLPLVSQFVSQDEPAYCGLSTLVMILNALAVDPLRTWKGVWRWYSESMLDCCAPLEVVKDKGVTLTQFACLAACNGLAVETSHADRSTEDAFRAAVIKATRQGGVSGGDMDSVGLQEALVVSYSRRELGQTGDGHFSPVGAYDAATDSVLVLDVARFKYPPHWVHLPLLWRATQALDQVTGQPRGFMFLRRARQGRRDTTLFRVSRRFGVNGADVAKLAAPQLRAWERDLAASGRAEARDAGSDRGGVEVGVASDGRQAAAIVPALRGFLHAVSEVGAAGLLSAWQCERNGPLPHEHRHLAKHVRASLEATPLYHAVARALGASPAGTVHADHLYGNGHVHDEGCDAGHCDSHSGRGTVAEAAAAGLAPTDLSELIDARVAAELFDPFADDRASDSAAAPVSIAGMADADEAAALLTDASPATAGAGTLGSTDDAVSAPGVGDAACLDEVCCPSAGDQENSLSAAQTLTMTLLAWPALSQAAAVEARAGADGSGGDAGSAAPFDSVDHPIVRLCAASMAGAHPALVNEVEELRLQLAALGSSPSS